MLWNDTWGAALSDTVLSSVVHLWLCVFWQTHLHFLATSVIFLALSKPHKAGLLENLTVIIEQNMLCQLPVLSSGTDQGYSKPEF